MDDLPTHRVAADERDVATACVPLPQSPPPQIEFNRYELLRELGKGGTGVVWLARDSVLGTEVALKTLRPDITSEPTALRELKAEVLINRTLTHPNIVKTFDFVTNGPSSAISMEYVSGTNLHRLKAERPAGFFETAEITKWILQLCAAMDYAHGRDVVHRDLKPANLMIDERGDLKVGDFGIGRTVAETSALTRNSSGTPPFMSPQQTMGERAVPSDDIYSIGATIYDLLTGDPPFYRGAIREQALAKLAPPMAERRKELERVGQPIPPGWEAAVAACLSKEAGGRPKTAGELKTLLETAAQPPPVKTSRRLSRRWLVPVAAVAALAAAMALVNRFDPEGASTAAQKMRDWSKVFPGQKGQPAPAANEWSWPSLSSGSDHTQELKALQASTSGHPGAAPAPKKVPLVSGPAHPPPLNPIDQLLASGQINPDEADLLTRALQNKFGEFDRELAARVVNQHTLSPAAWRNYTAISGYEDPTVGKLRPMLMERDINEKEFEWLSAALAGDKGDSEQTLAESLVDARSMTPAQWRSQTQLYPPPPVDPIVEKIKPLFTAGRIDAAERTWLEAALRGKKTDEEKLLAEQLLGQKSVTPGQWRARTSLSYPSPAAVAEDPAKWPAAIDLPLGGGVAMRLVRIDPGIFMEGTPVSERGRRTNEPAPYQVRIGQPFYLGVTEVTQAEYAALMPRNPSFWRGHADWPIDQVDWQSLTASGGFLDRLNHLLTRHGGSALLADLPTEAEWEYAARAGTQSSFYEGGPITNLQHDATLDRLANYNRSDIGSPQAVGSYAPNAWGLYDMLGNLSEWCKNRAIRGGSWQSSAAGCRIGWRTQSNPDADSDPSPTQGFRLLLRAK